MNPFRLLSGALIRVLALAVVITVYGVAIGRSDSTDALGAGLLAFLILAFVATLWALVDGIRKGFTTALVLWLLTSLLGGIAVPLSLTLTGANDMGAVEGIRDGSVFFAFLLFVPAFLGLAIGGLVRRMLGGDNHAENRAATAPIG
ncbi:MAG: hypothetical protein ABIN79_09110 [Marmoricola sp.]